MNELVLVLIGNLVVARQSSDIVQTLWSLQQKAYCFCLSNKICCQVHGCDDKHV